MRKLIGITCALVLMSASLNAKEIKSEEILFIDCIALAFDVDEDMGGISFEMFEAIVDNCEAQN